MQLFTICGYRRQHRNPQEHLDTINMKCGATDTASMFAYIPSSHKKAELSQRWPRECALCNYVGLWVPWKFSSLWVRPKF